VKPPGGMEHAHSRLRRGESMTNKLQENMAACRGAFFALAGFSALVNILMLTPPL
jgi:ABC-type protease/lipase transport system fused ATPase/permease subunit